MVKMKVKFKKLVPHAVTPTYAKSGDGCLDLTATSCSTNACMIQGTYRTQVTYGTGLAVEIPSGYVGLIFPRSSVSKTCLSLSNAVGIIDSKFRGEMLLKFNILHDPTEEFPIYKIGDRIGQILILSYRQIEFEEVNELSDTERGIGGFGSSGA
jgi:dUTP pyrophosphatase